MIEVRTNLGYDAINIGAVNCYDGNYLDNGDDAIKEDEIPTTVDMIQDAMNGLGSEEDMDAFFASAVHGGPEVSIDARHLSKVWRISYQDAKHTIDATTQHGTHHPNPVMNQNYTTNDQMLRYRRINQYFSWTPSLQQRRVVLRPGAIHVVNCLSQIRDLYMLCL